MKREKTHPYFRSICTVSAILYLIASPSFAHPSNYAVAVTATVQDAPARITLHFPADPQATSCSIYRRLPTDASWTQMLNDTTTPSTRANWADTTVTAGTVYEYRVDRFSNTISNYAYGFALCAIRRPMIDNRGKLVLIVDKTHAAALTNELVRLQKDLAGDGWTVLRHDVSPTNWDAAGWKDAVTNVKAIIKADYNADTNNVKAVLLFGHIPIPYAGSIYPDGHTDHQGSWPADNYYGEMNSTWSDSSLTFTNNGNRQDNIPGDGKFDNSSIPSDIDIQVGRVDLYNMPCFTGKSETDLLRQYLDKDHNYRMKFITTSERGLVDDNFGDFDGEAFAYDGWRNFGHMFGASNVYATDFFNTLRTNDYKWAYGCGGGNYSGASGVGSSGNFSSTDTKVSFTMLFGSYFGDWDVQNSFLRAPLGSASYTLSCSWGGRPDHYYHFMTLGETLGECMRRTQNASYSTYPEVWDSSRRYIHVALMGDPTLRFHIIAPASGLNGSKSAGQTALTWTASPEQDLLGYHVYRSTNTFGPYTRLSTTLVTGTTYTDTAAPAGNLSYMVRPVKLEISNAGSYTNIGQGIFAIIGDTPNHPPTANNQIITVTEDDPYSSVTLTGSDADGDPIQFLLMNMPQHGTVTGMAPNVFYKPATNFSGVDSFTFQTSDGKLDGSVGTVTVNVTPCNDLPTISITNPVNNASFAMGANIAIHATATDIEATVPKVEFYAGSTILVTDYTSPFNVVWTNAPAGTYALKAVATDSDSGQKTSSVINISVTNGAMPLVGVTIVDSEASEPNAAANKGTAQFRIARTGSTSNSLTVYYTMSGTAVNGTDYNVLTGAVTLASGSANTTLTITSKTDDQDELDETVTMSITANAAYTINNGSPNATVTIIDAEYTTPEIAAAATDATASEPNSYTNRGTGTIRLTRTGSMHTHLTVKYVMSGLAGNGTDYTALTGTVVIATNSSYASLTITALSDPEDEDDEETVALNPVADPAYTISPTGTSATVTILDAEYGKPEVWVNTYDAEASEASAVTNRGTGVFRLYRTGSIHTNLVVYYTLSGSAVNGADYTAISGNASIASASSYATITITALNDKLVEALEDVDLTFVTNAAYTVGLTNSGTITIYDNGTNTLAGTSVATVTVNDGTVAEPSDHGAFLITLAPTPTNSTTVNLAYLGTATRNLDFTNANTTIAIPANVPTGMVRIAVSNDTLFEGNETVQLVIVPGNNYVQGSPLSASLTIVDDDGNHAPIGGADSYSSVGGWGALNVAAPGVLANDSDPDGHTFTALKMVDPATGTLTLSANGGFSYTWPNGWSGTATFQYRAVDSLSGQSTNIYASILVKADADNDDMPDDWETTHGLSIAINDAKEDDDNDGASNLAEYLAGTDPTNALSVLEIQEPIQSGPLLMLSWQTVTGRLYSVEYCSNLLNTIWISVPGHTNRPGNGSTLTCTNNFDDPRRLYRTRATLP